MKQIKAIEETGATTVPTSQDGICILPRQDVSAPLSPGHITSVVINKGQVIVSIYTDEGLTKDFYFDNREDIKLTEILY